MKIADVILIKSKVKGNLKNNNVLLLANALSDKCYSKDEYSYSWDFIDGSILTLENGKFISSWYNNETAEYHNLC